MKKYSKERPEFCIGLDLGDKKSYVVVLDQEGEVIEEGRVATTSKGLQKMFSGVERSRVAMEAGGHSGWVSRLLASLGHEVVVANPRKLRLIYENKRKNDRVDAEYLARVALVSPQLLSPIQHRGEEKQRDLQLLRARDNLVTARTQLINFVRGSVKQVGSRIVKCSAPVFGRKARESMPPEMEGALLPVVATIEQLTEKIQQYDRMVEQYCIQKYPETKGLMQIRGVGSLTALAFVLTLEEPERFDKSRSVGPFLGLCPGRDQTGEKDRPRRITKEGNGYLRKLLIQSAHYILGPFGIDSDLRRHGEKIASGGSKIAKKRAVVAVARKLAVVMHRLWQTQEVYEPLHNQKGAA